MTLSWHIDKDEAMGDVIVLDAPITFKAGGLLLTVPKGFRSDGMSIPRLFWGLICPQLDFTTLVQSICHDWLYKTKVLPRLGADKWYASALMERGFPLWKTTLVYWGVRLWGWRRWR